MRKNIIQLGFVFLVLIFFSSCAPEGNTIREYGFFSGILHGFVFIFVVIGKIFNADVGIYAVHNSGTFYWLGFLFGLMIMGGGVYGGRKYNRS